MARLESSKTHSFLQEMLAGDAQSYVRLMYFAFEAEEAGEGDAAALLREVAQGEFKHAIGHLEILKQVGDPLTEMPIGAVADDVASALEGLRFDVESLYRGFMSTAREEEFFVEADWIESVIANKRGYISSLLVLDTAEARQSRPMRTSDESEGHTGGVGNGGDDLDRSDELEEDIKYRKIWTEAAGGPWRET